MTDSSGTSHAEDAAIPADDPGRTLTIANPEAPGLARLSIAGDTYTILVSGAQTNGRHCLIDMHIPPGGGPPPHRHDYEEVFTLLEGELAFTFRGETVTISAGSSVNIPANAPHSFRNISDKAARMLCMCAPSGLDEFFRAIGDPVDSRTAPPPHLSQAEIAERQAKAVALAGRFRTELLKP